MFNIDALDRLLSIVFMNLNVIRDLVYNDAVRHGFWADDELRDVCATLIRDEAEELMDAASDPHHFAEELADVIIMSLSVAGHLGIDIDAEVCRKIEINQKRPWRHEVIEK